MINTIYLDHEFNFLLLENTQEENSESTTKIYLNIKTDATTGQRLEISVAGGAVVTESIASNTIVKFELSQEYWADDNATEITPKNDSITGATITINFPKTFTTSAALNYLSDTEFDIQAQNEAFAESGSSGTGSGGSGGAAFDFVEIIRNIGFRLLDEPSNVNAYFDEVAEEVQIKWTDPADIVTNEPAPATWAGTVVVRKEGSAPLHRWDGVEIIDSTTRDEYSATALIDNTIDTEKSYYYGIFPYDTKGDYRFTKIIAVSSQPIPAPEIVSLVAGATNITVNYSVADRYTYDYITLVYKKNSAPADKTDGTAVSLSASDTSANIIGLDENTLYYFKIFAQVTGQSEELESNIASATTSEIPVLEYVLEDIAKSFDVSHVKNFLYPEEASNRFQYVGTDWNIGLLLNHNEVLGYPVMSINAGVIEFSLLNSANYSFRFALNGQFIVKRVTYDVQLVPATDTGLMFSKAIRKELSNGSVQAGGHYYLLRDFPESFSPSVIVNDDEWHHYDEQTLNTDFPANYFELYEENTSGIANYSYIRIKNVKIWAKKVG